MIISDQPQCFVAIATPRGRARGIESEHLSGER